MCQIQAFRYFRPSYLNETGRAGVVMSSQASSAGRDEAIVRQKLIETGAIDVMIDVRGNFFYTRTVPCQLWFFDRAKEKDEARRDHVLMLDARNIYRKVSRSVCDFSPSSRRTSPPLCGSIAGSRGGSSSSSSPIWRRRSPMVREASPHWRHSRKRSVSWSI